MKKLNYIVTHSNLVKTPKRVDEKLKATYKEYHEYLKTITDVCDKNLLDLYNKTEELHDYLFKEIKYSPWKKTVSIKFYNYGYIYEDCTIIIKKVHKISIKGEYDDEDYDELLRKPIDSIDVCEIGYYDGKNYIGMKTWQGLYIDIYFEKMEVIGKMINTESKFNI